MKKTGFCILAVVLAGCSASESTQAVSSSSPTISAEAEENTALITRMQEEDKDIGIAYIGNYFGSDFYSLLEDGKMNIEGTEVTIPEENCADMGGEQVYAVIPESTVEVADSSLDSSGNLFDSTDARFTFDTPFLLRCNESELFSNCVLKTEAHSFHPSLSMKDSHISMEEGYMDFSDYTNLHNIQTAYSLLMQISGIQGKVVQSTNHTVEINGKSCYTFETEDGSESYAVTDNEVYVQEDHGWKQVTE